MSYRQYVDQHQQLTDALNTASQEFEDLRKEYDSATVDERPEKEADLNAAIDRVEEARASLSTLESQNPQFEADRANGVTPSEIEAQPGDIEIAHKVIDAINHVVQTVAVTSMLHAGAANLPMDYTTHFEPASLQAQQTTDIADIDDLLGSTVPDPSEQNEATQAAVKRTGAAVEGVEHAYANAHERSGDDILKQNASRAEGIEHLAEFNRDLRSGIAEHGDCAAARDDAATNLYTNVTGRPYDGASEDLRASVAQEIEAKYGAEHKETFEQSYTRQEEAQQTRQMQEQEEAQQTQQMQEQSQGISY